MSHVSKIKLRIFFPTRLTNFITNILKLSPFPHGSPVVSIYQRLNDALMCIHTHVLTHARTRTHTRARQLL